MKDHLPTQKREAVEVLMSEDKTEEKKWRVRGVSVVMFQGDDLSKPLLAPAKKVAAALEAALNDTEEEGYVVQQVIHVKRQGFMVIGKVQAEEEQDSHETMGQKLFRFITGSATAQSQPKLQGAYSSRLFHAVFDACEDVDDPEAISAVCTRTVDEMLSNVGSGELRAIMSDCDTVIEDHKNWTTHENDPDGVDNCHMVQVLRQLKTVVESRIEERIN